MKLNKEKISQEGWKTTKQERINYYIGDLGRTLEGYIVTAFMTLFLLFQGISLLKISRVYIYHFAISDIFSPNFFIPFIKFHLRKLEHFFC